MQDEMILRPLPEGFTHTSLGRVRTPADIVIGGAFTAPREIESRDEEVIQSALISRVPDRIEKVSDFIERNTLRAIGLIALGGVTLGYVMRGFGAGS